MKKLPLIIGSFDVIHKGHKKLFNECKPNNFNVLIIINLPNKKKYFNDLSSRKKNIDFFKPKNIFAFDVHVNNMEAVDFIQNILLSIKPSTIIVGDDFKFGRNANGDVNLLKKFFLVKNIKVDERFRTTKIKKLYAKGMVEKANKSLLLPIYLEGVIVKNKQFGRKIGFPTININRKNPFILRDGVYASFCIADNKKFYGATYVNKLKNVQMIETHILKDFEKEALKYGKKVKILFIKRISHIRKCKNLLQLKRIIQSNIEKIKKFFLLKW